MKNPPKYIWLQASESDAFGPTWCEEKIHDEDVKYVRADLLAAAPTIFYTPYKALEVARKALDDTLGYMYGSHGDKKNVIKIAEQAINQINQVLGDK